MSHDPSFNDKDHCSVCKVVSNRLIEDDRGILLCAYCKEMDDLRQYDKKHKESIAGEILSKKE